MFCRHNWYIFVRATPALEFQGSGLIKGVGGVGTSATSSKLLVRAVKRLLLNGLSSNCHIGSCRLRMLADDISCRLDRRARVVPWPLTKQEASKCVKAC